MKDTGHVTTWGPSEQQPALPGGGQWCPHHTHTLLLPQKTHQHLILPAVQQGELSPVTLPDRGRSSGIPSGPGLRPLITASFSQTCPGGLRMFNTS